MMYATNEEIKRYQRELRKPLNLRYTAILKLWLSCLWHRLPVKLTRMYDGWILIYQPGGRQVADAIQHMYSYGSTSNLLEEMGLANPGDVEGYMTPRKVLNIWLDYREKHRIVEAVRWHKGK